MKKTFNKLLSVLLVACFLSLSMVTVASAAEDFDSIKGYFSLRTADQFDETKLPSSGLMSPSNYFAAVSPSGFESTKTTLFYVNNSSNTASNNAWYQLNFKNNSATDVNLKLAILGLRVPTAAGAIYQETITVPANGTAVWGYGNKPISGGAINSATHLMGYQQDYAMDSNAAFFFALMPETSANVEVSLSVAPFTNISDAYPTSGWETVGTSLALAGPAPSVTSTVTITKDFIIKSGYEKSDDNPGDKITDIKDKVTVTPTFEIEPYKAFNRLTGKSDIPPAFSVSTFTIPVSAGINSTILNLPDYVDEGVGDYWYKITEQPINNVAGVEIDNHATRYLHVQVVWDATAPGGMRVNPVTLHATAPNAETGEYQNVAGDKTEGFTNTYGAGELKVTKNVDGNMGDPDKSFAVNVTLTAPDGKSVTGHIYYTGAAAGEITAGWSGSKTVTVNLKKGDTVTFTNIPDGVTYEIAEDDYTGEGYKVAYAGTNIEGGDAAGTAKFTGTITDSLDEVTITNTKDVAIDVGVILDNAPFILLLVGSMAFFAVYFVTKRRKEEETY